MMCAYAYLVVCRFDRSTIVVGFGAIGPEAAAGASERVRAGVRLEHVSVSVSARASSDSMFE